MCNFNLESAMLENHVPTSYTVHERNGAQERTDTSKALWACRVYGIQP